jgi:hypothetical protein
MLEANESLEFQLVVIVIKFWVAHKCKEKTDNCAMLEIMTSHIISYSNTILFTGYLQLSPCEAVDSSCVRCYRSQPYYLCSTSYIFLENMRM